MILCTNPMLQDHVGNCSFGRSQGKETGQAQEYERCSQLEVRRKLDSHVMPFGCCN